MLKGSPSYARQITKEDNLINWNQNARKIIKKVMGLYPNAYTFHNGKRIKILEANISYDNEQSQEILDINNQSSQQSRPGEIIMINKEVGVKVMTSDYPVQIKYAQLEGKKATDSYTLSIQSNLSIHDIFDA
jgi:methionyl-tRNA formyltransferase